MHCFANQSKGRKTAKTFIHHNLSPFMDAYYNTGLYKKAFAPYFTLT